MTTLKNYARTVVGAVVFVGIFVLAFWPAISNVISTPPEPCSEYPGTIWQEDCLRAHSQGAVYAAEAATAMEAAAHAKALAAASTSSQGVVAYDSGDPRCGIVVYGDSISSAASRAYYGYDTNDLVPYVASGFAMYIVVYDDGGLLIHGPYVWEQLFDEDDPIVFTVAPDDIVCLGTHSGRLVSEAP